MFNPYQDEERGRRRHYGSPYAPGPRYWLESEEARYYAPIDPMAGSPYGSPYAQGLDYEPYYVERSPRYGHNRYGSPYAPGPQFEAGTRQRRWGWDADRYGSPYAPGPRYFEEESGPYTGVGPRGYRRSDNRILEEVSDRLMQHGGINASEFSVSVQDGEVILEGNVDSLWTKRAAEDTAFSVLGVEDVHNHLSVSWSGRSRSEYYNFRTGRESFETGMTVVGRDGNVVGTIAEVRSYDFKVRRESDPDIYVPFGACLEIDGSVVLDIPAKAVNAQQWPTD
jgi:hypothetical protein